MKKRSFLMTVLAMVLVAVISVGGTFAYLTATDAKVENTFSFADNMKVTITEEEPDQVLEEKITPNGKGWSYDNVVPDQALNKAPQISTTTEVAAYVFVKVSGASANVQPTGITEGWNPVGTPDSFKNGVYYKAVNGAAGSQDLGTIFTQVKVGNPDLTGETTVDLGAITVEVYEIQQGTFADVDAAFAKTPFAPATPAAGA